MWLQAHLTPANAPVARFFSRATSDISALFADLINPVKAPVITLKASLDAEDDGFRRLSFTFAYVGLNASLIRAGNGLTRENYLKFCAAFPLEDASCPKLRALFAEAWAENRTPEAYARQILSLYPNRPKLYRKVMKQACSLALAEQRPNATVFDELQRLGILFGLSRLELNRLLGRVSTPSPHRVLGVKKSASREHIRKRYRALMKHYHPDRIQASARYPETLALALRRSSEINAAYAALK